MYLQCTRLYVIKSKCLISKFFDSACRRLFVIVFLSMPCIIAKNLIIKECTEQAGSLNCITLHRIATHTTKQVQLSLSQVSCWKLIFSKSDKCHPAPLWRFCCDSGAAMLFHSGVTGVDRPGVTPCRGWHPTKIFLWLNLERTLDKRHRKVEWWGDDNDDDDS